ncbi:hypothetical protein ACHAPJ_011308 [Fusarium lateritium]
MHSSLLLLAALALGAHAAPVLPTTSQTLHTRGDGVNVGGGELVDVDAGKNLPAGNVVEGIVDKLPVDVEAKAPVLPGKRDAAPGLDIDLGGQKRDAEPGLDIDLGSAKV